MLEAMKKVDLMVVVDPYPSASAAMFAKVRKDGAYLLPAATQLETEGSVTASNRSLQWREKVIDPVFDSRTDQMIMYQLAQKLGFADQLLGKKDGKQNIRLVKGKGGDSTTGYPQFDHVLLKKLGWWDELTDAEKAAAEGKTWANDLSGGIQRVAMKHGCTAFGNAKARAVVWNFPDPIPQHREPLYSPRPDLVEKYPTHDDVKVFWRLPTLFKSVQQKAVKEEMHKKFPLILTSGRIVEYEGGGDETRSNPWLAELQQENYVEINPKSAADRSIRNGEYVWLSTPSGAKIKVKAKVTEGIGPDTVFVPFHFSGWWQGEDMLPYYPEGAAPIVRGEAS